MNWDDLRVILYVSRLQTLSEAGKVLGMDPSTLSRRVSRLEKQLDQRLFLKNQQGYQVTEYGVRLVEAAEAMETHARSIAVSGSNASGGLTGTIRIGAPDGSANFLLPSVCQKINQAHPNLDLQILAMPRVLNLSKGEADFAVTVSLPAGGRMLVQKIADYHLHLAASRDYLNEHGTPQDLSSVKMHPVIGYIPDLIFDPELDYLADVLPERTPQLSSNSVSVQINMIARGMGIGVMHDFASPFFPEVETFLHNEFSLTRSFYLVRHAADARVDRLNLFAKIFVAEMKAVIGQLELAHSVGDG